MHDEIDLWRHDLLWDTKWHKCLFQNAQVLAAMQLISLKIHWFFHLFLIPWLITNVQTIPCTFAYLVGGIADVCIYSIKECTRDKTIKNPLPPIPNPDDARKLKLLFFNNTIDPVMKRNDGIDEKPAQPSL